MVSFLATLAQSMLALWREWRGFDAGAYLRHNPDVARAGMDPWRHYHAHGFREGRSASPGGQAEQQAVAASGLFDAAYYLETYSATSGPMADPLAHFCQVGALLDFNSSAGFDVAWYRAQHPDCATANPILHHLASPHKGATAPPPGTLTAAQLVLAGIAHLEPGLDGDARWQDIARLPIVDGLARGPVYDALRTLLAELSPACRFLVFAPWLIHGGADLVISHVLHLALETQGAGAVALVLLDSDRFEAPHLVPDGVLVCRPERGRALSPEQRVELVEVLLRAVRPQAVLNVNCRAAWDAFAQRGTMLAQYADLYAYLFCRDFADDGRPAGYADSHFRDAAACLRRLYLDNATFATELTRRFGMPQALAARMAVVRQPSSAGLAPLRASRSPGPLRLLWAGRLCRQKNLATLGAIIERLPPEFQLDIWGLGAVEDRQMLEAAAQGRSAIRLLGAFAAFAALPLADYDALLYTSSWDGLPNVLIEAGAQGLPIIASLVGGVGELIDDQTGWPVVRVDDAAAYIAAMTSLAADPERATKRAAALQARIADDHSWAHYAATMTAPGELLGKR